jgi:hypothetical protein
MAENNRYRFIALDTPDGLQDDIVNSPPTLFDDKRGRKLWIYDETPQITEYTNNILKMVGTDAFCWQYQAKLPIGRKYQ